MQKFIAIDIGAETGRVIVGDVSKMEIIFSTSIGVDPKATNP